MGTKIPYVATTVVAFFFFFLSANYIGTVESLIARTDRLYKQTYTLPT